MSRWFVEDGGGSSEMTRTVVKDDENVVEWIPIEILGLLFISSGTIWVEELSGLGALAMEKGVTKEF